MKQVIAIEPTLTPIKDFLTNKGYNVESINFSEVASNQAGKYDAFIVTGMNTDFLGMSNTSSKAVVIDARGMTAEQVFDQLKTKLQ